jgi:hypothetical protein
VVDVGVSGRRVVVGVSDLEDVSLDDIFVNSGMCAL